MASGALRVASHCFGVRARRAGSPVAVGNPDVHPWTEVTSPIAHGEKLNIRHICGRGHSILPEQGLRIYEMVASTATGTGRLREER